MMIDWRVTPAICGLRELAEQCTPEVTHLLSILDPEHPELEDLGPSPTSERLTLRFHDVIAPTPGSVSPEPTHVEAILEFGRKLPDCDPAHLLVHCHAGVSRSTAAMTALLAQAHPDVAEADILAHVRSIRPQTWPNSLMIAFADRQLGRNGRLLAALSPFYAAQLERFPHVAELMTDLGRGAEVEMALSA
jgi:predicted protein tyrosine phosphatase